MILDSIGIQYVSQKIIKENGKIYFFDICIKDIMIEINGDFWHANPYKYKSSDLLKFPKKDVLVSDIWKKDLNKKNCAIKNKYNVVYLWESYIKKTPNEKIIDDLIDIIENKNFIDKNEYKGIKN